jgi:hypothetical protein
MSGRWWPALSSLDARVLRATDPLLVCSVARVASLAGCGEDVARSSLRRLRRWMLVEADRSRPARWRRTVYGDVALEHEP